MKKLSLYLQALFYVMAGINHFVNAGFYLPLIPEYLPLPEVINVLAGVFEIAFGLGLIAPRTRSYAAIAIVLMLIAFVPSHVYFIQIGGCIDGGLCAPPWIGWLRLVVIHPLLIWWAWSVRRTDS